MQSTLAANIHEKIEEKLQTQQFVRSMIHFLNDLLIETLFADKCQLHNLPFISSTIYSLFQHSCSSNTLFLHFQHKSLYYMQIFSQRLYEKYLNFDKNGHTPYYVQPPRLCIICKFRPKSNMVDCIQGRNVTQFQPPHHNLDIPRLALSRSHSFEEDLLQFAIYSITISTLSWQLKEVQSSSKSSKNLLFLAKFRYPYYRFQPSCHRQIWSNSCHLCSHSTIHLQSQYSEVNV